MLAAPLAAQPRSDTLLRDEIAAAIEEADLPIGLFDVDVRDGVAVLSGEVLNEATQSRVVEIALFVDGVTAVETDITVLEPEDLADPEEEAGDPEAAGVPGDEAEAAPPPRPAEVATRPDDAVQADVAREIERADLEGNDPRVAVNDGVVRLTGQVVSAWEWRDVVERAEEVEGVVAVDPDLEVAEPESMEDLVDGIRSAVLRYSYYTVFDDINFGMDEPYVIILRGAVTEPFKEDGDRKAGRPGLRREARGQPDRGPAALAQRPGPPPRPLLPDLPGPPLLGPRQPDQSSHPHCGVAGRGGPDRSGP